MTLFELLLIALALSMDAFAVSVSAASTGRVTDRRASFRLVFSFGFFQFAMPILGWTAGVSFDPVIAPYDHWVAFALLLIVGLHMIRSKPGPFQSSDGFDPTRGLTLLALATAVSIDALALGMSLAMLRITIWFPSVMIGVVTALVSLLGILLGSRLRLAFARKAEIAGGIILILIAIRIVVTHLFSRPEDGGIFIG